MSYSNDCWRTPVKCVEAQRIAKFITRYADDFVITSSSRELLEQEVKPAVEAFLRERGLTLSQEKTSITHIEDGFDFLGQHVRKYKTGKRHKLLITPSKKNVKAFLEKIRGIVKANQAIFSSVDEVIYQTMKSVSTFT